MKLFTPSSVALALSGSLLLASNLYADANKPKNSDSKNDDNVILVTAELQETNVLKLPNSVTVIDSATIRRNNAQHFSDLLNLAPNVNFATGASRGRFVQIRGIGERSEFSEPVNYSVGVVVDGIDLTGIATAATTLDVQQVEVLRGPQGTLYGANGLAGLINIVSNTPTQSFFSQVSAGVETYAGRSLSGVVSDTINDELAYRFAVGQYQSNGFMDNDFLARNDTNNIDETSMRGKVVFTPTDNFSLTTHIFFVDVDNGYDAFSLDADRNTLSDMPGYDRQQTRAASLTADWQLDDGYRIEAILSGANSDLEYAYDEDWTHTGICNGLDCDSDLAGFDWWYSSFDNYIRENKNNSFDVRLHSENSDSAFGWVLGLYARDQKVDLLRHYTFAAADFSSRYDTQNTAFYGQIKSPLTEKLSLTIGARSESKKSEYVDSNNVNFMPDENFWGGKVSLEYDYDKQTMLYLLASRGYKAGGFNTSGDLPAESRVYGAEFMWNYEAGIKGRWLDNTLTFQTSIFYQDREDIQSRQSLILSNATGLPFSPTSPCPCSFNDYLKNAEGGGISYGLELETKWQAANKVELYSSLGILKTAYKDFKSFTHDLADNEANPPIPFDLHNRAFAHSPDYQLVLGGNYFVDDNWRINTQIEAKDSFYFSDRHEVKSNSYELLNWGLTYQQDDWNVNFFIRNVTDKNIQTRGFGSFPNDPRNFYLVKGPYYQFAAPRTFALTASLMFD